MICSLNNVDPLPLTLGAKVVPLNLAELTPAEKAEVSVRAFEKSRWYDIAHGIDTAFRDDAAKYRSPEYWYF